MVCTSKGVCPSAWLTCTRNGACCHDCRCACVVVTAGMLSLLVNNGRDISRGIKSRQNRVGTSLGWPSQRFDKSGSVSGWLSQFTPFPRHFGTNQGQSRLSPFFSLKLGRVRISSTFPNFRLKSWGESGLALIYPNFYPDFSRKLAKKVGMSWDEIPTYPDFLIPTFGKANPIQPNFWGRGGGARVRALAFCPSRPGSTPGTDLAFFGSELLLIYSRWALGFF